MVQSDEGRAKARFKDGDPAAALAICRDIIDRGDATETTYAQAGEALNAMEEYARAVEYYRQALSSSPESPELHNNIALPLNSLGEADLAAYHLERAIPALPGIAALANLACIAPGVPGYDLRRIYEVRRAFGMVLADPRLSAAAALDSAAASRGPLHAAPRPPRPRGRPLHVAYLSAHFGRPAYMGPVWAAINHHDRSRFKISMLADAPVTGAFPGYRERDEDYIIGISGASDAQIAQCIVEQEIDVLVDLSAYSFRPRLSLFSRRVASVVVAWFNMYATSGLPGVDYIVGDRETVYPGEEAHYTETFRKLPQSYLSFLPFEGRPDVGPSRQANDTAPFTFGSLVSLYKITRPVRDAWAEILKRSPASRLLIANADLKSAENRAWLTAQFQDRGVDPARLLYRDPAPHARFLRYYDEIDLALDAFPYSGGTTTMEALWQGVPVLTQVGDGWAARTTASIIRDADLYDFCCRDVDHYVRSASKIANSPEDRRRLAALRETLRPRLIESTVCDGQSLAGHMETLYDSFFNAT